MTNLLSTLGLAKRAGALKIGETQVYESIQSIRYLFLANDVGPSTKNKVEGKCHFYHIPINASFNRDELSKSIGTLNTVMIGVVDAGFVELFKEDPYGKTR